MGGGMPSPEEMQKLAQQMPGGLPSLPGAPGAPGLPPTMPGLPGLGPKLPGGPLLPGLGGKPPGLPGSRTGEEEVSSKRNPVARMERSEIGDHLTPRPPRIAIARKDARKRYGSMRATGSLPIET